METRKPWHELSADAACEHWGTDPERGLSEREARERLERVGPNELPEPPKPNALVRFLAQFADPLVGALLVAAVVALWVALTGDDHGSGPLRFTDTGAIVLIVVLNAVLGFLQERRAEAALDALKSMAAPTAEVLRDGELRSIPAAELVPGDIVSLGAGDALPADVRLISSTDFAVEESPLTGESTPVEKDETPELEADTSLADRSNMAHMGTTAVRGDARGLVVQTGAHTEIGRIGALIRESGRTRTPLEDHLARYGRIILLVCVVLSAVLFAIGMVRAVQPWPVLLLTAVSLAVAAIPEGLPAITTITLALGMLRMARRGAIVRKLPAVETLGSATVICSDKTGTLTQNAMTVRLLETHEEAVSVTGQGYEPSGELLRDGEPVGEPGGVLRRLLVCGAVCNEARLFEDEDGQRRVAGDPTEGALLVAARKGGVDREVLLRDARIERRLPFDSDRKRMAVVIEWEDGSTVSYVKGSPDLLLERCSHVRTESGVEPLDDETRRWWHERNEAHAGEAYRVLAFAEREDPGEDPEQDLVFLGLAAMMDPPRPEVEEAVADCHRAGIHVAMVTGDHRLTAIAIARELGFWEDDSVAVTGGELEDMDDQMLRDRAHRIAVFARVTAEQKLRIVRAFGERGDVVAVTGDGVNDAPALREAPIGVAMGQGGTDVAREAAAMVLADDNFATIVHAVREGRAIFSNIQKFVFFLNSSNAGLVIAVIIGSFFDWMPPLTPLHLLWINLVTNGLPALALGVDPPEPGQMERPPRPPGQGIMGWRDAFGVLFVGALMGLMALGLYFLPQLWPGLFGDIPREQALLEARSMAFTLLAVSPLFHAHNCRSSTASIFSLGPFRNRWLWGAIGVSAAIHLVTLLVPPLRPVFRTEALHGLQWAVVVGLAFVPIPVVEALKALERLVRRR